MKRIRLQLLINEKGFTQNDLCDRISLRKDQLSKIIHGIRNIQEEEMAEIALVLGTTLEEVRFACNWKADIPKVHRACPWCDYVIPIIAEDDIIMTMENVPDNCPHCSGVIDIVSEEDETDREETIWWLTRGEM